MTDVWPIRKDKLIGKHLLNSLTKYHLIILTKCNTKKINLTLYYVIIRIANSKQCICTHYNKARSITSSNGACNKKIYKGGRSSAIRTGRLYPRRNPWYSFSEAESTSGHVVLSEGTTEKIPSDTTGNRSRDLNHYATQGPLFLPDPF